MRTGLMFAGLLAGRGLDADEWRAHLGGDFFQQRQRRRPGGDEEIAGRVVDALDVHGSCKRRTSSPALCSRLTARKAVVHFRAQEKTHRRVGAINLAPAEAESRALDFLEWPVEALLQDAVEFHAHLKASV